MRQESIMFLVMTLMLTALCSCSSGNAGGVDADAGTDADADVPPDDAGPEEAGDDGDGDGVDDETPADVCANGIQDPGEENVDCGGACPACVDSVEQWGITWTFDRGYRVGRFANLDYWVLGPVTVTQIDPAFDGQFNGWEVNPVYSDCDSPGQAFDARIGCWQEDLMPDLPYTARPMESIVKAISFPDGPCGGFEYDCLETAAVLTVLGRVPPDDGATIFRPPYVGSDKPFYSTHDLRMDILPAFAPVPDARTLDWVIERFQRVQMDHKGGNQSRALRPMVNFMDGDCHRYGACVGNDNGEGVLALLLEGPEDQRMEALIYYVQFGIDWTMAAMEGHTWSLGGPGVQPAFKIPIAFAATMLDDDDMKRITSETLFFDNNYLYASSQTPTRALYGSHDIYWSEDKYWQYVMDKMDGVDVSTSAVRDPYGYIDAECPEIGYQFCCTANPWKASALAGFLFPELREVYDFELLFDYADRWKNIGRWTLPDPCAPYDGDRANLGVTFGPDGSGGCIAGSGRFPDQHGTSAGDGYYGRPFVEAMWDAYRGTMCYDGTCDPDETPESCPYDCPE